MRRSIFVLGWSVVFGAGMCLGQGSFYVGFFSQALEVLDSGSSSFSNFQIPSGIYPYALAVDPQGDVYVADGLSKIYKFDSKGTGGLFADAGQFSGPIALTFGPDGYLYSADYRDWTVRRYDSAGNESIFARPPMIDYPEGMAVDGAGNVYVLNRANSIYKFDPFGHGSLFATNGLNVPVGLAMDSHGNLFVANSGNNTIYRFDQGGNGSLFARTDPTPFRMAFDPAGNLYVTFHSVTDAIERFDPSGNRNLVLDVSRFGFPNDIAFIPEPSTVSLVGGAATCLCVWWRGRKKQ